MLQLKRARVAVCRRLTLRFAQVRAGAARYCREEGGGWGRVCGGDDGAGEAAVSGRHQRGFRGVLQHAGACGRCEERLLEGCGPGEHPRGHTGQRGVWGAGAHGVWGDGGVDGGGAAGAGGGEAGGRRRAGGDGVVLGAGRSVGPARQEERGG